MSEIEKMYQERIMDEAREPFNFFKKEEGHTIRAYNPICGDRFDLNLEGDMIYFHGFGCTISKASTSFMIKALQGKSVVEARKIVSALLAYMDGSDSMPDLPSMRVFENLELYKGRKDCIVLSWKAMDTHFSKTT